MTKAGRIEEAIYRSQEMTGELLRAAERVGVAPVGWDLQQARMNLFRFARRYAKAINAVARAGRS